MFFILAYIAQNFVFGIILPYLPILLRNLNYSAAVVGVLLAIAEGAGILGPLLLGRLADRGGKYKRYIILTYVLTAAAALPITFFVHPVFTALMAALLAIGFRSTQPLVDAMTTVNLGEKGNYGKIRVAGSIGYVCFMFFMQWIPVMRPNSPGNIIFWICVTAVFGLIVTIPIPSKYGHRTLQPEGNTVRTADHGANDSHINREKPKNKSIWTPFFVLGLVSIALNRLAMTPVNYFFSLFLVEYMHWDAVGLMTGLSALAEIPLLFFSNRIIRRYGAMPIIAFTSVMVAVRLGIYALFPFKAGIIIAQLLHCFCFGLFHPAAVAFISSCVPPEQRSFGMTLYISVGWGIPALVGNFISGFIVDYAGYRSLFVSFTAFAILGVLIYVVYRFRETLKMRPKLSDGR